MKFFMDELIKQSKNGDEKSFTELILKIQNDLYKIARTRLDNDNDINDAIQETMIKAFIHLKKLKDNSKFKSWIIKILINECNKIYRKRFKNIDKELLNKKINELDNEIQISNSKLDFNILISLLNYEERLIITLSYYDGYTCKEIAKILNKSVNTVKSKMNRAKQKIRKYYDWGDIYE